MHNRPILSQNGSVQSHVNSLNFGK